LELREEFLETDQFSIIKILSLLSAEKRISILNKISSEKLSKIFIAIFYLKRLKFYPIT